MDQLVSAETNESWVFETVPEIEAFLTGPVTPVWGRSSGAAQQHLRQHFSPSRVFYLQRVLFAFVRRGIAPRESDGRFLPSATKS